MPKIDWKNRLKTLADTIELQIALVSRKEIDVVHLFYDGNL
jgi:hypothetical protein